MPTAARSFGVAGERRTACPRLEPPYGGAAAGHRAGSRMERTDATGGRAGRWICLERQDLSQPVEGGFCGGNTDRPALQRLLEDVQAGKVDVIVVYKVDRLTRSLADFAKLVELFDQHNVSFVSVTQQFNTTTSMGRLTLNVLLSFAQF